MCVGFEFMLEYICHSVSVLCCYYCCAHFPKLFLFIFFGIFFFQCLSKLLYCFEDFWFFLIFFDLVFLFLFVWYLFLCDTRLRSDFFATILSAKAAAVNEIHYDDVVIENYYWKRVVCKSVKRKI